MTEQDTRAGRSYDIGLAEPMSNENEGELPDGTPFGLLQWGQAGIYNAVDDRMVITGVSDSQVGIVRQSAITFGNGLHVVVPAGWLAIASCFDGTTAVVGSRQSHTLPAAGGPASGTRTDHVWVDTFPDDGRWELRIIPQGQTLNRPGVSLCRLVVPAGANQASQFQFTRLVPTIGRHADAHSTGEHSGTGWVTQTPDYPIAPYVMRPNALFKITAYGEGRMGATAQRLDFRMSVNSSPVVGIMPQTTAGGTLVGPRERFDWYAEAHQQVIEPHGTGAQIRDRVRCSVRVTLSRYSDQSDVQAGWTAANRSVAAVRNSWGTESNLNVGWQNIQLRARWGGAASGQWIRCMGSTYEQYLSYHE